LNELSKEYELTPKQISEWKKEFLAKAALVFNKESPDLSKEKEIHELHARIGQLDITYIPMRQGFMYLAAIIDVFSRRIMGWGLSNTMEAEWCAEIAEEAFLRHGRSEIFNTDQGSQFTSEVFITTLVGEDFDNPKLKISMDGRGRATDDIYIERFWRSIKYDDIYLNAYEDGVELWHGIDNYIRIYNTKRLHQSLDYQTPDEVYKKAS
jgi:putative transposase